MTTFTPAQLDTIRAQHDIFDYASRYTTLKRESGKEYSGPCPICKAGEDRFHVDIHTQRWMCRYCTGDESWHDVIEFRRRMTGETFPSAVESLGGRLDPVAPVVPITPKKRVDENRWKSQWYQQRAAEALNNGVARLDHEDGAAGRAYLAERGITEETARAWRVGFSPDSPPWIDGRNTGGPSVTMAYLRAIDDLIMTVRYRRINADEDRYVNLGGGTSEHLYGLHLLDPNAATLVIIEGEFNAMSIWQVTRDLGVCVVSTGNQGLGATKLKEVAELSARYPRCIVWCDEPEKSQQLRGAVVSPDVQMRRSPKPSGSKVDANDMLQQGVLRSFMERILRTPTVDELRALLKRTINATPSNYLIAPDLCDFDAETSPALRASIAAQLHTIIRQHERRQAA